MLTTDAVTQCSHGHGIASGSKMCTVPPLLPTVSTFNAASSLQSREDIVLV